MPISRTGCLVANNCFREVPAEQQMASHQQMMFNACPITAQSVIVNVYDIPPSKFNRLMSATGLSGAYHSALVVYGKEWTFLGHPFKFSGIYWSYTDHRAHNVEISMNLMKSINFGETPYTTAEVEAIASSLGDQVFRGDKYDLLHHNCNHFTDRFLSSLIPGAGLPGWVNRLARIGRPLSFISRLFCDKVHKGYYIIELLYMSFAGDAQAVQLCLGEEFLKFKHIEIAIENAVQQARIPGMIPFHPVLHPSAYRKVARLFKLKPLVSVKHMKDNISLNMVTVHAESIYEFAWRTVEKISQDNDRALGQQMYDGGSKSDPLVRSVTASVTTRHRPATSCMTARPISHMPFSIFSPTTMSSVSKPRSDHSRRPRSLPTIHEIEF